MTCLASASPLSPCGSPPSQSLHLSPFGTPSFQNSPLVCIHSTSYLSQVFVHQYIAMTTRFWCTKTRFNYACGHPGLSWVYCESHKNNPVKEIIEACWSSAPSSHKRTFTMSGDGDDPCGNISCQAKVRGFYCCSCPPIPGYNGQPQQMAYVHPNGIFLNSENFVAHYFGDVEHIFCSTCRAA
jgi:hypothetical protein